MVEYIIIAIAFAIMVHFRYIAEVLQMVNLTKNLLDIKHTNFSPVLFSITFLVFTTIFMPILFIYIFTASRDIVLKDVTSAIIKSYFHLEEK